MLKFFRKIRHRLLKEGRVSRYLLYALGEILLVMIGILLALQINNWNTNNIEKKELHNYLKNIQNNLEADLIGIEKIKSFRDSSAAHSRHYLRIAEKEKISIKDYSSIMDSEYRVQYDEHFQAHKSGFETLKNSGYMGKLHGTEIENHLNEFYYIIDKIHERETSLNNTIENMENIASTEMQNYRMSKVNNIKTNKQAYFDTHQKEIKALINNPSMISANYRNRANTSLLKYYQEIENIAKTLIAEIDNIVK
jgi:hypothetical protein